MTKQRIEWIDLAKGFGIIFIIAYHIRILPWDMPRVTAAWVPLFFFMSGLFFKRTATFKETLVSKTNSILVPFLFFYITSYGVFYLAEWVKPGLIKTQASGILDLFTQDGYFNGPIWFLLSLYWDFLIMKVLYLVCNKTWMRVTAVLALGIIGIACAYHGQFFPLKIPQALSCLPFFYLGDLMRSTSLIKAEKSKVYAVVLAVGFLALALGVDWTFGHPSYNISRNLMDGNVLAMYIVILCTIFSTILFCQAIQKLPLVSYYGKYSMVPLCLHHIVYRPILLIFSKLPPPVDRWSTTVLTILVIWMLIPLVVKYLPWFCGQKPLIKSR